MQQNVLYTSNVSKIFLVYVDGKKFRRKEEVKIHYIDNKNCYFAGQTLINFTKPKWRTKTDIIVYTPDGVYSAQVIIRDTEISLNNIFYKVDIPKSWKFTQLRSGSRKKVKLPVKIKFNDGLEIEDETFDLSVGGFSIISNQNLSTVNTRFNCDCQIKFPENMTKNFPNGLLETSAKYVRSKTITDSYEMEGHKLLCFRFINLSSECTMLLKHFLLHKE